MAHHDVLILGGGAAGEHCAGELDVASALEWRDEHAGLLTLVSDGRRLTVYLRAMQELTAAAQT